MGAITVTRGIGWRDDIIISPATANWTLDSGVTFPGDGDQGTLSGTTGANGANENTTALSTTTYPLLMVRALSLDGLLRSLSIRVNYTVGSDTFSMALTSVYQVFTFTLTPGKTLSSIKLYNQTVAGTILIDFVMFFKEVLILPIITRPFEMRRPRRQIETAIPMREGSWIQDLGSGCAIGTIEGLLIGTGTPNTGGNPYTALQWLQILQSLEFESNSVVDSSWGGPTWQWLTSDDYSYKVAISDFSRRTIPGRDRFAFDFTIRVREVSVISLTSQMLGFIQ